MRLAKIKVMKPNADKRYRGKKELAYVAVQCVNCYNIFGGYLITYIKS